MSLVTSSQLGDLRNSDSHSVLLDVRWQVPGQPLYDAYLAGHIAGAVFVDLDRSICGPASADGRHPLPDPASLQQSLRDAGINDHSTVVVYDGGDMLAAARTWWTLRWAGLEAVYVLDGGIAQWDGPLSTDVPQVSPGTVTITPGQLPVLDAAEAGRLAHDGVLIDVRSASRFRGEPNELDPVAGHVPEAINIPGERAMDPAGGFADTLSLRKRFRPHADTNIGVYCGSGVTAARTALAMTVAGLDMPALYVGSWSNWIADPSREVATGDG